MLFLETMVIFSVNGETNIIYECDICIATDESLSRREIAYDKKELTHLWGLMKDSLKYPRYYYR